MLNDREMRKDMKVIELTGIDRANVIAPVREILSPADIIEIIEPVSPDKLQHTGQGVYEALWWMNDEEAAEEIARLSNMLPRVIVLSECPYRPRWLPDWIAVEFCIVPLPMQTTELIQ